MKKKELNSTKTINPLKKWLVPKTERVIKADDMYVKNLWNSKVRLIISRN